MHALSSGFIHESPDQFQFVAAYAARSRGLSKRKLPDFLSPKQLHPQPPQKDGCDGTLRLRVKELQFRATPGFYLGNLGLNTESTKHGAVLIRTATLNSIAPFEQSPGLKLRLKLLLPHWALPARPASKPLGAGDPADLPAKRGRWREGKAHVPS